MRPRYRQLRLQWSQIFSCNNSNGEPRPETLRCGAGVRTADVDGGVYIELTRRGSGYSWDRLDRIIYGLVQASRCFDHKLSDDLEDAGSLSRQNADPCAIFRLDRGR